MKLPALVLVVTLVGFATTTQDGSGAPEPLPVAVRRLEQTVAGCIAAQGELKQQLALLSAADQKARDLEAKVKSLEESLASVRSEAEQLRNQPRDSLLLSRASGARASIEYRSGMGYGVFLGDTDSDLPGIELGMENGSAGLRLRDPSRQELVRLGALDGAEQPALEIHRRTGTNNGRRAVRLGPMAPSGGGLVLYADDGAPLVQLWTDGNRKCYLTLGNPLESNSVVIALDRDRGSSIRVDGREVQAR